VVEVDVTLLVVVLVCVLEVVVKVMVDDVDVVLATSKKLHLFKKPAPTRGSLSHPQ